MRRLLIVVALGLLTLTPDLRAVLPATDAFTGTGALSASWTDVYGGSGVTRVSDVAKPTADSSTNIFRWNADTFANDQYAQVQLVGTVATGTFEGPGTRLSGGGGNGYLARCTSANCLITRLDAGSVTDIATITMSPISGDTIKLTSIGTTHTVYQNGISRGSTTDATHASGSGGITLFDDTSPVRASIDNFEAGDGTGIGGGAAGCFRLLLGVGC